MDKEEIYFCKDSFDCINYDSIACPGDCLICSRYMICSNCDSLDSCELPQAQYYRDSI